MRSLGIIRLLHQASDVVMQDDDLVEHNRVPGEEWNIPGRRAESAITIVDLVSGSRRSRSQDPMAYDKGRRFSNCGTAEP